MARKTARQGIKPFSASSSAPADRKPKQKAKKDKSQSAYTYIPSLPKRHRTSEQTLSLSREEAELGKPRRRNDEEDSDDDMNKRIRKVAMMIAEEGPGGVESDESDVDSDEAWEDDGSDEERWGDVFRDLEKGKKKKSGKQEEERVLKPKKPLTVNLDESDDELAVKHGKEAAIEDDEEEEEEEVSEDEDEDEDGDEDEDEEDESSEAEEEIPVTASTLQGDDTASVDEEDEEEQESDEDDSELELPSDLSGDEEGPDTLDGLDAFVDRLAEADKKRKSTTDDVEPAKKRRVLPVISGPALGEANDLGLKSSQKVDLASLIASHPSLSAASSLLPSKSKSSSSDVLKQGVLSAPLPTVVQDRLNREVAYEKTKEEGAKWSTLMKRVKEAEHLSFPLQGTDRGGVKSTGELLSTFKPSNEHESGVQALLARANLTESGVKAAEDEALKGRELSHEEIAERRAMLRQQRELMFREEKKSKRVAKIKSKTFRKLARKRAAKNGEDAELEEMDEEDAMEAREKLERQRAKERATLKHSAKTGRWASDRNAGGEEYRQAREEMFDMKERLNRRIAGKGDGSDDEGSDEDDDMEGDEEDIRRKAFDQLDQLDQGKPEAESEKGLMGMKFMKKADERRKQQRKEDEAALREDIAMFGVEESGDEQDGESQKASVLKVGGTGGRMVFSGPNPSTSSDAPAENGETSSPNERPTQSASLRPSALSRREPSPLPAPEENPWLASSAAAGPSRKRNTVINANSSSVDKANLILKKAKAAAAKTNGKVDDESVDIETDGNKLLQKQRTETGGDDEDEDLMPRKRAGFKQRDLVAEAFAGDNVVEEFADEKQRAIEADAPKVEDTSLPGWGSWGGKGARKRNPNPKFLKTIPGIAKEDRKDAKYSNVIITEKKDKKASAFQVKDLPYPYTSVAQYEARFSNPLGAEWNSRQVHQKETLPRVTKKKGAIIEPVRRLF